MANHPIMIIERYCDSLIAEHRAKVRSFYTLKIKEMLKLN